MTELQAKILDMLKWFDHYCREQKLTYYAVGGTLLGAVRHKGFIPLPQCVIRYPYECFRYPARSSTI